MARSRENMAEEAAERAKGATEALDPCRVYDSGETYIYFDEDACQLDMCRSCSERLIARRAVDGDRIEVFHGGEESDSIHHCGGCGVPLLDALTSYGAEEELAHWETHGLPNSPDEWREFLLMVEGLAEELLPRAEALLSKASR